MEKKELAKQVEEINQKLDLLTGYIQEQQRRQREFQELKEDLIFIGKDVFQTAVDELEEISPYFETRDLIFLLKKLLRNTRNLTRVMNQNTRNLTRVMNQLENIMDFMEDAKPLGKAAFNEVLEKLNEFDRKGYFEFFTEAAQIIDTIVTSFSVEDVRLLRENITSILLTVKGLTQPEMLTTVNNAIGFYKKMDIVVDKDISYRQIIKELRDPEVKRGLAFMLEFVKNMAAPNGKQTVQALNSTK
jgi:uncharacterized protein YjgD (DUF1641 family)